MASASLSLEADIDARLLAVWLQAWSCGTPSTEEFGALLRMAYGRGYTDALAESQRGQLYRDHGFSPPSAGGRS